MRLYKKRIKTTFVTAAFAFTLCGCLCGCIDISNREFIPQSTWHDEESTGVGGNLLITELPEESETEETAPPRPENITAASFSEAQLEFIESCLFMGDSICSGIGFYGLSDNCYAKAGVAARNIEEFTFDYNGAQVEPMTAIVNSGLKNLVFMMGLNDVNIENSDEFTADYDGFLSRVEALCPDASVYVLSITPVTEDSSFCYNYEIDSFNEMLREMIEGSGVRHFVDVSTSLKDSEGNLRKELAAEDGVHLMTDTYYDILFSLCEGAGVW